MKNAMLCAMLLLSMASGRASWMVSYEVNGTTVQGTTIVSWSGETDADNAISLAAYTLALPDVAVMSGTVRPVFSWVSAQGEPIPEKLHAAVKTTAQSAFWWEGSNSPISVHIAGWKPGLKHLAPWWNAYGVYIREYPVPTTGPDAGVVRGDVVSVTRVQTSPADLGAAFLRVKAYAALDLWAIGTSTDGTYGQPPPFFSGTNCEADAHARVNDVLEGGPQSLRRVEAWVGDASVSHSPPGGTNDQLNVVGRFDSTHFQDQAGIQVKVVAVDEKGKHYSARWTGTAWNKAAVAGDATDLPGARAAVWRVAVAFRRAKHSVWENPLAPEPATLAAISASSAFYTWTHGSPGGFGDGLFEPPLFAWLGIDPNHWITAEQVEAAVADRGILPGEVPLPEYNFVFLDACNTAGPSAGPVSQLLSNSFGVYTVSVDRVFAGWQNVMEDSRHNLNFTSRFLNGMVGGRHAWAAWRDAIRDGVPQGWDDDRQLPRKDVRLVLLGDRFTKIRGLYMSHSHHWLEPE